LPAQDFPIRGSAILPDTIYNVAIIGGGPGGYSAAFRAGQLGLKTCLIEKDDKLGGTCLHVGCIPTKALLFNAEIYDHLKDAELYGIDGLGAGKLNWKNIQDRKTKIVAKHTKGLDFLVRKNKVDRVLGFARVRRGVTGADGLPARRLRQPRRNRNPVGFGCPLGEFERPTVQ